MARRSSRTTIFTLGILALCVRRAFAHPGHEHILNTNGLLAGFIHPVQGLDHILAAVTVGLLAACTANPSLRSWRSPLLFVCGMMLGLIAMSMLGHVARPEFGIPLSIVLLGMLVWLGQKSVAAAAIIVLIGAGFYHGYVHALEGPQGMLRGGYTFGLVFATAALHVSGYFLGTYLLTLSRGRHVLRWAGGAIALTGVALLLT